MQCDSSLCVQKFSLAPAGTRREEALPRRREIGVHKRAPATGTRRAQARPCDGKSACTSAPLRREIGVHKRARRREIGAQKRAKPRIGIRGPNFGAAMPPAASSSQTRPR
ncbi:hypothetical protein GCM10010166_27680 [Couchioplanes caeruleus subsp. azureus]|nr:hypothetical protein GCM10010166_27680 [Couchioplanes caeruleus subsp. azureus]